MTIPYRPLAIVREIINAMGLEVTYAYEDLVHVEHNAFLLQMGESGEIVNLYFNTESLAEERDKITDRLCEEGQAPRAEDHPQRPLHNAAKVRRGEYRN